DMDPPMLAQRLRDRVVNAGQAVAMEVEPAGLSSELNEQERCGVAAPLRVAGDIRYILIALHSQAGGVFGPEELQLMEYLCTMASAVLDNLQNVEARFESETRFRVLYEQ